MKDALIVAAVAVVAHMILRAIRGCDPAPPSDRDVLDLLWELEHEAEREVRP